MPGMRHTHQAGYHRRTEQSLLFALSEVKPFQSWPSVASRVERHFSYSIRLFPQLKQQALKGHAFYPYR
jgi:hypothetical protein